VERGGGGVENKPKYQPICSKRERTSEGKKRLRVGELKLGLLTKSAGDRQTRFGKNAGRSYSSKGSRSPEKRQAD